jgi:GTP-binding protein
MFIDETEISVRSGAGGNGMVHFHREKFVPRGGPDGGDGGRGGSVLLEVRPSLTTLQPLRHTRRYAAEDGRPGGPNNMSGRSAPDLIISVPAGTLVYDASSGEQVGDLTRAGDRLSVCTGGRGGRGNQHFATARNQAPRTAEKGEPGQSRTLRLELKLIADIGIIGVPNAGKSTLLAALTNARPKIAAYPFTTVEPNLGVARFDEDTAVVLADIPGLLEGASKGVGLGHEFLRHIQRTRVLIHVLDGEAPDPLADYAQINAELSLFDEQLSRKPQIVAFNKIDQSAVSARLEDLQRDFRGRGVEIIPMSAISRNNTREVLAAAIAELARTPTLPRPTESIPVFRPPPDPRDFKVAPDGAGRWRLFGASIERAASMTYWEHPGSVRRFQRLMQALGVDDALRASGVKDGDTVAIGEYELDWQE